MTFSFVGRRARALARARRISGSFVSRTVRRFRHSSRSSSAVVSLGRITGAAEPGRAGRIYTSLLERIPISDTRIDLPSPRPLLRNGRISLVGGGVDLPIPRPYIFTYPVSCPAIYTLRPTPLHGPVVASRIDPRSSRVREAPREDSVGEARI